MKVLNELYTVSSAGRPSKQRANRLKSRTPQLKHVTKDQILNIGANRLRFQRSSSSGKVFIRFIRRSSLPTHSLFCRHQLFQMMKTPSTLSPRLHLPVRCAVSLLPLHRCHLLFFPPRWLPTPLFCSRWQRQMHCLRTQQWLQASKVPQTDLKTPNVAIKASGCRLGDTCCLYLD